MSISERLSGALADRYHVERELGQGGMATVYLAEDLKHGRQVAIKVLHPDLAAALGGERFLSEIRTTARLQHPHILPLLDSGTADGLLYYVMPYVAGETLRDRLVRETQLPVAEALRIAREVADALAHAHGIGIIHRDIKPENILLQGGHAVVADFGIALAVQQAGGQRMTQTGLSLGTPQYMAPEQAMGEKTIDARADVYALGAVTYEMLAGAPPFTGPSVQAIVAKILTDKPVSLRALRESVPEHVEDAVLASLAKLPADRIASAEEFSRAISTPGTGIGATHRPEVARPTQHRVRLAIALAIGLVAGVGAAYPLWHRADGNVAATRPPVTFVLAALGVQGMDLSFIVNRIAATPDGKWIAYVAGGPGGGARVYLRSIDDLSQRDVAEGRHPIFSPDSKRLAYADEGGVMVVPIEGGVPSRVSSRLLYDGSWGPDDRIWYVAERAGQFLYSIPASGGERDSVGFGPDTLVTRGELLAGGRLLLSLEIGGISRIAIREADGPIRVLLDGAAARYAPTGHLVFTRRDGEQHGVFGARFDASTATLAGNPEALVRDASRVSIAAATSTGDLVYLSGTTRTDRQIVAVDRSGDERPVTRDTHNWVYLRLGADESTLVANTWDGASRSVWTVDAASGAIRRLTRDLEAFAGAVSRDSRTVYFNAPVLSWVAKVPAAGGTPVGLETPSAAYVTKVSPDGSSLWLRVDVGPSNDIWRLPLGGAGEKAVPVLATPADERDAVDSPNGSWLAYRTDASGRMEAVLAPMATPGNAVQISTGGGVPLNWSNDSQRLFYRQGAEIWEVRVGAAGAIRSTARRIFSIPPGLFNVEIAADGERLFAIRGGMIYTDLIVKQGALK